MNASSCWLAAVELPLFGYIWLALATVLAAAALIVSIVALKARRVVSAPPPVPAPAPVGPVAPVTASLNSLPPAAPPPPPAPAVVTPVAEPPAEVRAMIAAIVAFLYRGHARVVSVQAAHPASPAEMMMQQWSMEGRRQIYSSHQIR